MRKWQPTSVVLPGEFHRQRSLAGYSLWGHKESDTTKQLTRAHTHTGQIDGETMETRADFISFGSKITVDGDCSLEIERCLLLGRKTMTNLGVYYNAETSLCHQRSV